MEDIGSILDEVMKTNFDAGTEHRVTITHITDPLDFYVRPRRYWKVIEHLETTQTQIKPSALNLHDVVMFKRNNSDNSKYARGKITAIKSTENITKYDLIAFDYGDHCEGIVEEYIWECEQKFTVLPPLAVACRLANCAPIEDTRWSFDSIETFKIYIGNETPNMLILDKSLGKLIVELKNFCSPHDIATLMALTGYSTWGYVHNAVNRLNCPIPEKKYFTFKKLQIGDILRVRVQSGTSLKQFYVVEVNDYRKYLDECENITYFAKEQPTLPEHEMKKDTIVCVKDDLNNFERAIIQEVTVPGTKAKVQLVDSGNEKVAHILNMRNMSDQCLKLPVTTIYCSTDEQQVRDNGLHRFLYPGFEFVIKVKQLGDNLASPNIVDISPSQ